MAVPAAPSALPAIDLPPAYSLVVLDDGGDAFAAACALAPSRGAGTFVWSRRDDVLDFAVVLEPEEPLSTARRALFAGLAALADAVASAAPPEKPVGFWWPATIAFDEARLGGGRLAWPAGCPMDETPAWLVFSAQLMAKRVLDQEPGLFPHATWLEEEGFDPLDHSLIVESFSRHLMAAFDAWSEDGFAALAERYLSRLSRADVADRLTLADNGDLLLHCGDRVERVPFPDDPRRPDWLDLETGTPRLGP
jgi:hypothetical protein